MKMTMKRILSLALCAMLLVGMMPAVHVQAAGAALPGDVIVRTDAENAATAVPAAPEVPMEPIGDPREEIGTMDVTQSDNFYYFTTFQDLKELSTGTYDDFSYAIYEGDDYLVISESLVLPDNLGLNCASLQVPVGVTFSISNFILSDNVIINGTLILNKCFLQARHTLTVNGTLNIPSGGGVTLTSATVLSGRENIVGSNYRIGWFLDGISSMDALEKTLSDVDANTDPHYWYDIYIAAPSADSAFTINKSLTFPKNLYFSCTETGLIISSGCTLTINGGASLDDITVNGILQNNSYIHLHGSASFRSPDSYKGSGWLYVLPESTEMTYEDLITGLDFSRFEITYRSSDHQYNLRDVSGFTKLATPTGLQWGTEYLLDHSFERPGAISWQSISAPELDTIRYGVHVYQIGEEDAIYSSVSHRSPDAGTIGTYPFVLSQLETGTYYFTVQALGDDENTLDSDIATSPEWTYVAPSDKLSTASELAWNWPYPNWSDPSDVSMISCIKVTVYFGETADAEPIYLAGHSDRTDLYGYAQAKNNLRMYEDMVNKAGAGYYYFTVQFGSSDITEIGNSDESALSPGYYYDPADHTYVAQTPIAPTCTEQGYTPYRCAICGESYNGDFTPATGHSWTAATCTAPKTCTVCGTTIGSALGHNYENGVCTRCDAADPGYVEPAEEGVYRIAGADRIATSLGIADTLKQELGVSKFSHVIVASALNFPDALTGSYLAAVRSAPILLTYEAAHAKVLAYIEANLAPGGTVYILGGQSAVSAGFESQLNSMGITVRRLAGTDRFSTNLAILNEAGVSRGANLLVCTAYGFADSLSVSATGLPILLVGKSLTEAQKTFLRETGCRITIIGGTSAVSDAMKAELSKYGTVSRLCGDNRYLTSYMVAQTNFTNPSAAVMAYAWNYPDGLCGGPLAYTLGAPLLLTDSKDTNAGVFIGMKGITAGYVLGGSTLIDDPAVRRAFGMGQSDPILAK